MRVVILLAVYFLIGVSAVDDALALRSKWRSADASQTTQTTKKNTTLSKKSSSSQSPTKRTLRKNKTMSSRAASELTQNKAANNSKTAGSVKKKRKTFSRTNGTPRSNDIADTQNNAGLMQNNTSRNSVTTQNNTNTAATGEKLSLGQRIKNKFRRNKTPDNQLSNNIETSKTNRSIEIQFNPQIESEFQKLLTQSVESSPIDYMPRIMSAIERNVTTSQQRTAAKGDAIMNAMCAGNELIRRIEEEGLHRQFFNDFLPKNSDAAEQQPAAAEEQPAAAEEQPATAEEQPATAEEQPATAEEQPAAAEEQPATAEEQPATAEEQLAPTELPAATAEQPAATAKQSAPAESLVKTSTKLKGFDDWLIISELLKVLDDLDALNKDKIRTVMQNGIQIGSCLLCKADNTLIYELADMPDYGICVPCLKKLQSGQTAALGEDIYDKAAKVLGVDRSKLSSLSKGELQAILQKIETRGKDASKSTTADGSTALSDRTTPGASEAAAATPIQGDGATSAADTIGAAAATPPPAQGDGTTPAVGTPVVGVASTAATVAPQAGVTTAAGTPAVGVAGTAATVVPQAGVTTAAGTPAVGVAGTAATVVPQAGVTTAAGTPDATVVPQAGVTTAAGIPAATVVPQAGVTTAAGTPAVGIAGTAATVVPQTGVTTVAGTPAVGASDTVAAGNNQLVIGPNGTLVPLSSLANTTAPYGYTRDATGNLVPAPSLESALLEAQQLLGTSSAATQTNAFGQIAGAAAELAGNNTTGQMLNAAAGATTLAAGGINLVQQMQEASTATQLNAAGQLVGAAAGLAGQNSKVGQALNTAADVATLAGGIANIVQAGKQMNQNTPQYQNMTQYGNTTAATSDFGKQAAFNNTTSTQQTSTATTAGSGKASKMAKFKKFSKRNK